ncbi:MAG: PAS domain-containing protein [Candidatus Aminicenantes bacterium]|nr:PAS domain-containing protein [Candidatus Aminicenantes bacterium]
MKKEMWTKEFPAAITVCNTDGVIIEMNEAAAKVFEKDGGAELMGKNALDCHPEPARTKMRQMLENPAPNAYTIEKDGQKKLIYQCPWYENNEFRGIVELSFPIPDQMPHFKRQAAPAA